MLAFDILRYDVAPFGQLSCLINLQSCLISGCSHFSHVPPKYVVLRHCIGKMYEIYMKIPPSAWFYSKYLCVKSIYCLYSKSDKCLCAPMVTYLLTPWSRVLLEKLTSLCS
jgi:hypothetical protein